MTVAAPLVLAVVAAGYSALTRLVRVNVLVPVKRFLLAMPWAWTTLLVAVGGWQLGGPRLAALVLSAVGQDLELAPFLPTVEFFPLTAFLAVGPL